MIYLVGSFCFNLTLFCNLPASSFIFRLSSPDLEGSYIGGRRGERAQRKE
jgi:hypothetical protein